MRGFSWLVYLAALAAGNKDANKQSFYDHQISSGLVGAGRLVPPEEHTGMSDADLLRKKAIELKAECVELVEEIQRNVDIYPAERIRDLKSAIEAKLKAAFETTFEYRAALRNERDFVHDIPVVGIQERTAENHRSGVSDAFEGQTARAAGDSFFPIGDVPSQSELDLVMSPDVPQRGIVSISGTFPATAPKQINWEDVFNLNSSIGLPASEKPLAVGRSHIQDAHDWKAVQEVLNADQAARREDEVIEDENQRFPRRLDAADPSALYFQVQNLYGNMYSQNVTGAKNLTPRTLLSWVDLLAQKTLAWVDGAPNTTLGQVWDLLVESRGAALPSQETTVTADSYNEAFWFKGVTTAQLSRYQHILGYSVFQLQLHAQLEARTSPAEAHGNWPWLTNQQIVEMVKQYDAEAHVTSLPLAGEEQSTQQDDVAEGYHVAGMESPNEDISIADELPKITNASKSSEAYRAAIDLLSAGAPAGLLQNLSARDLEQLKLTYNSMVSERELQIQENKIQEKGTWPWLSWEDMIGMISPPVNASPTGNAEGIELAKQRGFSDDQLQDLNADEIKTVVQLYDTMIEDQQSMAREGKTEVRGLWPWFSWDDLIDASRQRTAIRTEVPDAVSSSGENSPEARFARKRSEILERKALMQRQSVKPLPSGPATHGTAMTLPQEVRAKVIEANKKLSAAQADSTSRRIRFPNAFDFVTMKNSDTLALESFGNLRGAVPPEPRDELTEAGDNILGEEDIENAAGSVDLGPVLTQLQILDSMLI